MRVFLHLFAVHRQRTATHTVKSTQARHTRVAQLVSLEIMDGTYGSIYLVAFILAGPVYNNALKNRAALLCRALRRVNRLCSRTLSDPANRLRKTRKKKSSVVPIFEAVTYRKSAPRQFAHPAGSMQKIREIPKKFSRPKRRQKRPFSR